jgi:hypothetical protein
MARVAHHGVDRRATVSVATPWRGSHTTASIAAPRRASYAMASI